MTTSNHGPDVSSGVVGTHVATVKTVTYLSDGTRRVIPFPCNGGVSILIQEKERCDREYYTPQGVEIDVSGTGLESLSDPRNGEPYKGVVIHVPGNGQRYTRRENAYWQWRAKMVRHGHYFADEVYFENARGLTIDAYKWPLKSSNKLDRSIDAIDESER